MKTLNELQAGDWVRLGRTGTGSYTVRRLTPGQVDYLKGATHLIIGGRMHNVIPASRDEIAAAEMQERTDAEQKRQRMKFESREGYKLAARIASETESGNYDRLSLMPIERLRQIAAWMDEHTAAFCNAGGKETR